uniref:Protein SPT2 homolog n=1 Tax=Mola mola TaxID=94237 RepID=A0A3Q3X6E0_MOLML
MDFDNILDIASQNQGVSSVKRRYSLQVGPPKKDPKSKGVNPAAVQALLKKQSQDSKKKDVHTSQKIDVSFIKQKKELLAKRVELKSDRKARAMASRTKDNFRGYNGIPIVEVPKKRRTKLEMQEEYSNDEQRFRNNSIDPEDDEDNYEYEQSDSEPEQVPEPLRPGKNSACGSNSGKPSSKKPSGPPKPAQSHMNFADLLKLAEKKQFEPVELKPKVVKKEERLRTADEIRELELERKAKRQGKDRELNPERERDQRSQSSSGLTRKGTLEREQKNCRPLKNSLEKPSGPSGAGKKPHQVMNIDKGYPSSKSTIVDRDRPKKSHSDKEKSKTSMSTSSGVINSKVPLKATSSQISGKQGGPVPSSSHKSSTSSDLGYRKESSLLQGKASGISGTRPSASTGLKSQRTSSQQGSTVGSHKSGKGEPLRSGSNSTIKSSGNAAMRLSSGGLPKAGSLLQARPGATLQAKAVPGRPGSGGPVPGRSTGSLGSGPGRPKCTVVSETISSKNVGGNRTGIPLRPGMPQRPGMAPRPMMNRPPGLLLPPITSAYKRKYEDEEYDSEMDDFIDDSGDEQEEVSKHIKEIFGYDRTRYKEESDYALKFMESSWRDMQKEEARSLKLAVQEDLDEEKKEEEDRKKSAKRKRNN